MYGNSIQIPCISKTWIAAFLQSRTSLSSQVYQSELNTANVPVFLGLNSPKMGKNLIFFNKNQFKGRGGGVSGQNSNF